MAAKRRNSKLEVPWERLGAREREILEILFAQGEATAASVHQALATPPTYSSVRGMLALLEQKGYVKHRRDGLRYVYSPTQSTSTARGAAAKKLVDTFFGGSPARAVATLLDLPDDESDSVTIAELRRAVLEARKEGR
jgi:predicted transcriptional regulator